MPATSSSTVATEQWVNCYDKRSSGCIHLHRGSGITPGGQSRVVEWVSCDWRRSYARSGLHAVLWADQRYHLRKRTVPVCGGGHRASDHSSPCILEVRTSYAKQSVIIVEKSVAGHRHRFL